MQMLRLIILCLTGTALACSNEPSKKERLTGHWQAVEATEEGRPLEVSPEEIKFWFYPDNTYAFESTLNYREAGYYQIRSKYLLTTDTLTPDALKKAVEIIRLTPDSLTFGMLQAEKERTLTLVKVRDQNVE